MIPIDLPDFHAQWSPLRMETIPGSGECMTVAILVHAASGQSAIRQAVQPRVLAELFGMSAGKGVGAMVAETVHAIQRQLDAGIPPAKVEPPFGGFELGAFKDCVARDINDVFDVGVRLSAAFGESNFGRNAEASEASQQAFDDWADRVKLALLKFEVIRQDSEAALKDFNVRLRIGRKHVRFGLLHNNYAANFGVLRPGHISGDMRSLKVKVFDLQGLKREQLLALQHTDVLVGCPAPGMLEPYSKREVESFHQSMEYIEVESRARGIRLVRCDTAERAANHVAAALRAA